MSIITYNIYLILTFLICSTAERLEELSRLKILQLVPNDTLLDELPLPKRIIEFVRHGC